MASHSTNFRVRVEGRPFPGFHSNARLRINVEINETSRRRSQRRPPSSTNTLVYVPSHALRHLTPCRSHIFNVLSRNLNSDQLPSAGAIDCLASNVVSTALSLAAATQDSRVGFDMDAHVEEEDVVVVADEVYVGLNAFLEQLRNRVPNGTGANPQSDHSTSHDDVFHDEPFTFFGHLLWSSPSSICSSPVNRLQRTEHEKVVVGADEDDCGGCSICLEAFTAGNELARFPCTHLFHRHCIARWLNHLRTTCPLCRRQLCGR